MFSLASVLKMSYQTSDELLQQKLYQLNLEHRLIYAFKHKLFVDVDIRVQDKVFKAHKCILAFYSTIFQKTFFNEKSQSSSECILYGIDPGGFKTLLRTIYYSTVLPSCSVISIFHACDAAEKLDMASELKEELMEAFMMRFSNHPKIMKVFWIMLEMSQSLKLYEIKEALLKYAEDNHETLLKPENILIANSDTIKLVLHKLNLPDSMKLEVIASWSASKSNIPTEEKAGRDLLSCVNYRNLTPVEFHGIVSKHDEFIDMKDAFDILVHLVEPTACSLPSWCTAEEVNSDEPLNFQKDSSKSKFSDVTSKTRSLAKGFKKMFKEQTFVDISLYDNEKKKMYKAHSLILALGSPVLASMLYGPSANKILQTEATDLDLIRMIRWFYEIQVRYNPQTFDRDSRDRFLKTFDTARMYRCAKLQKICRKKLKSTSLTPEKFWMLMDEVTHSQYSSIKTDTLIQYGQIRTKIILDNCQFFSSSKASVIQILKCNSLNANEHDVLNHVAAWLEKNGKDFTTTASKQDILKYIRLENLSDEDFYKFLKRHDKIFSPKDAGDILLYLLYKSQNNLPKWCYTGPLRGLCYKPDAKIGTAVWIDKGEALDERKIFIANYTVRFFKRRLTRTMNEEHEIQYLELLWRVKGPKKDKFLNHKCSITITFRPSNKTLSFVEVDMQKYQRIMVPVFFLIQQKNEVVYFDIYVKMSTCCRLSFPKEDIFIYRDMEIKSNTNINCISDVVVSGWTSERFQVPKHLLQRFRNEVTTTEKWCN